MGLGQPGLGAQSVPNNKGGLNKGLRLSITNKNFQNFHSNLHKKARTSNIKCTFISTNI